MSNDLTNALILLLVAIAPTLVVGLTRYPRAYGVLVVVWRVVNAFSVATHRDSPGTFKAPGTMSQNPNQEGAP